MFYVYTDHHVLFNSTYVYRVDGFDKNTFYICVAFYVRADTVALEAYVF